MNNSHRAYRQFERMFPGIAYQEHLRTTNPQAYRQHMKALALLPEDLEGELVAVIIYDHENQKIRIERANSSK